MATLFSSQTPGQANVSEAAPRTLGNTVVFALAGQVTRGLVYGPTTVGAGTYEWVMWQITADDVPSGTGAGTLLGSQLFGVLTPGVWNSVTLSSPINVSASTAYRYAVRTSEGRYAATGGLFSGAGLTNGSITAPQTGTNPTGIGNLDNGSFGTDATSYPNQTFGGNGYFVDLDYTAGAVVIPPVPGATSAVGWRGLQGIMQAIRDDAKILAREEIIACPNDGEPLLTNVDGVRYCPYDSYRPKGQRREV